MPYRRYKFGRKRYYRKYRRGTLSTRNIYLNRSSRSQATQIAAIKRKVNKVYRACKPEKKFVEGNIFEQTFSNGSISTNYKFYAATNIEPGTSDSQRIGNRVFRKDSYRFRICYSNNAQSTSGLHEFETPASQVRVIVGIWKEVGTSGAVPNISDILSSYSSTGEGYRSLVVQPLSRGITERHRIIHDRIYTVSLNNPISVHKLTTPWYDCRYDKDQYHEHSWILFIAGDLDYDTSYEEHMELIGTRKTTFTDA